MHFSELVRIGDLHLLISFLGRIDRRHVSGKKLEKVITISEMSAADRASLSSENIQMQMGVGDSRLGLPNESYDLPTLDPSIQIDVKTGRMGVTGADAVTAGYSGMSDDDIVAGIASRLVNVSGRNLTIGNGQHRSPLRQAEIRSRVSKSA